MITSTTAARFSSNHEMNRKDPSGEVNMHTFAKQFARETEKRRMDRIAIKSLFTSTKGQLRVKKSLMTTTTTTTSTTIKRTSSIPPSKATLAKENVVDEATTSTVSSSIPRRSSYKEIMTEYTDNTSDEEEDDYMVFSKAKNQPSYTYKQLGAFRKRVAGPKHVQTSQEIPESVYKVVRETEAKNEKVEAKRGNVVRSLSISSGGDSMKRQYPSIIKSCADENEVYSESNESLNDYFEMMKADRVIKADSQGLIHVDGVPISIVPPKFICQEAEKHKVKNEEEKNLASLREFLRAPETIEDLADDESTMLVESITDKFKSSFAVPSVGSLDKEKEEEVVVPEKTLMERYLTEPSVKIAQGNVQDTKKHKVKHYRYYKPPPQPPSAISTTVKTTSKYKKVSTSCGNGLDSSSFMIANIPTNTKSKKQTVATYWTATPRRPSSTRSSVSAYYVPASFPLERRKYKDSQVPATSRDSLSICVYNEPKEVRPSSRIVRFADLVEADS